MLLYYNITQNHTKSQERRTIQHLKPVSRFRNTFHKYAPSPPAYRQAGIPLPAGERGRVRGNYLEFLNKYAANPFAMVQNEPEHLLNELLRHDTRRQLLDTLLSCISVSVYGA
jgi:hypothetical protein